MVEIVLASTMAAGAMFYGMVEGGGCAPAFDVVVTEFDEKERACQRHWDEFDDSTTCNPIACVSRSETPGCPRPKGKKRTFSAFICPDGQMRWKVKP